MRLSGFLSREEGLRLLRCIRIAVLRIKGKGGKDLYSILGFGFPTRVRSNLPVARPWLGVNAQDEQKLLKKATALLQRQINQNLK